jgi:hypothetical protein
VPFAVALASEFPLCPSAGLFGIPCPGCGLTRATLAALHGHWQQAFVTHPLFFVLSPVYVGAMLIALVDFVRGPGHEPSRPARGGITSQRWFMAMAVVLLVLTLGVWGARFFDAFGGPVPVQTYSQWSAAGHSHH